MVVSADAERRIRLRPRRSARPVHDRHGRVAGAAREQGRESLCGRPSHARTRVQDTNHQDLESRLHAHAGGGARVPRPRGRCRVERTSLRCALPHDLRGGSRLVWNVHVRPRGIRARRIVLRHELQAHVRRHRPRLADGCRRRRRCRPVAVPHPAPLVAGVTHTAGGLVLTGDLAGNLYAFDNATGKVAFQTGLGGAIAGGGMTYAARGRQYVAATAGNIGRTTFGVLGTPTLVVLGLGTPAQAGAPDGGGGAENTFAAIAAGTWMDITSTRAA